MSRPLVRSVTAVLAAATMVTASLLGVQAASAALDPVNNISSTPQPPKKMKVTWDSVPGATSYEAVAEPGSRLESAVAPETSVVFEDLAWSQTYTVTVTAYDGTDAAIASGTQVFSGTKLNANLSPFVAKRGARVTIDGTLQRRNGSAISNAKIYIQRALVPYPPYDFKPLTNVTTNARGAFSVKVKAATNATYQALYRGPDTAGGWDANGLVLSVKVPISLRFSDNPVRFGRAVRFSGSLDAPAALVKGAPLRLQHKVSGRWKTAKATTVASDGTYRLRYKPRTRTDQYWRVLTNAGDSFADSTSASKKLVVR